MLRRARRALGETGSREALDEMTRGSGNDRSPVAPVDLSQAIIGPGMAVFSKYDAAGVNPDTMTEWRKDPVERCPIGIVKGVLNLFADLCDGAPREADDASEQGQLLPVNVIAMPRNR
jgi:hypothetical protein